ncbi:MAG: right-handed parallel beta-helix repeat-containing protein [Bacteroidota bacterium]
MKQIFGLFFLTLFIFSSCKKDEQIADTSAKPIFSTDSVLFDTVFTTVGSTTKTFKIYNRNNQQINISRLFLATGSSSPFRINVDGVSGTSLNDIEIGGGDSLFVFVQVTVNPTGLNSPLLIRDSIVFETNNNRQHVMLTAIGQDVYLHKPDHFSTNGFPPYSIITCNDVWTNDKPHLIFGYAVVDEGCTLTIQQGVRVHLNNKAVLWVYKGGTLIVNGIHGNEVTFQGARLEADYKNVPGQWGKIWLSSESKNNVIDWAIIKNGSIGVQADTLGDPVNPTLLISNTIVKNMSAAAIYGQGTHIRGYNCVFANCGQYIAALTIGGKYKFEHCTFANYWTEGSRSTPLLAMSNYYVDVNSTIQIRDLDSAYFGNCILYGDMEEEIGLDSSTFGGIFNYKFDHCFIKTAMNTTDGAHYNTVSPYQNVDPQFVDVSSNNYQLKATSPAIDQAGPSSIVYDLNNQFRPNASTTSIPDIGAYEYY